MAVKIELDYAGIGAILRGPAAAAMTRAAAESVAANLRAAGFDDVAIDSYVTDRAASGVVVRDSRAAGIELRDGTISDAARAAGLEYRA